jgi:hypothetical protein
MNKLPKNPVIYEINTWVWLHEIRERLNLPVTLAEVPDEIWDGIAQMHIDAVWFMGVWQRSPAGITISNAHQGNLTDFRRALPDFDLSDNVGSPYCIRQYRVDDYFGGPDGLAGARAKLAARGIRLILDFVPNHLAHDHPWVAESPEFFIRGNEEDLERDPVTFVRIGTGVFACGKDPFYPAWQDVLQVNAFHPGLRNAICETLLEIAARCDGVRCDMAMLVMSEIFERTWSYRAGPVPELDYWTEMIPAVKKQYPAFHFIAEAYWNKEWELQQQGFDFCYDKRLYDRLEKEGAEEIRNHLQADAGFQQKLIRFIENHDEPRAVTTFPASKAAAAAVSFSTLPGGRLYHEGQLEGRRIKLPVFLQRRPDENPGEDLRNFYLKLLEIINSPLFHDGVWELCECQGWPDNDSYRNLLAWCWTLREARAMVIINYSEMPSQGMVRFPWRDVQGEVTLADLLSGQRFLRQIDDLTNNGLYAGLDAWECHLFRCIT